jgi:hypothetical protein
MTTDRKIVPTDEYEPVPDKPGFSRRTQYRLVKDVLADIAKILQEEGLLPDEYFNSEIANSFERWPAGRWIVCDAVTGNSEGHYIHVAVISGNKAGERDPKTQWLYSIVLLGKTFQGLEFAQKSANRIAQLLDA